MFDTIAMFNDNPLSALEACGLRGWRYLIAWFHVVVAHIASAGIGENRVASYPCNSHYHE